MEGISLGEPRKMEGPSSKADSVSLGPRDKCVGEQCTSIFLLPPFFLQDFMMLCESGDSPASQPPCKGFVGDRTLVRSLCSCLAYFKVQANEVL